jgi:hypothetical protein
MIKLFAFFVYSDRPYTVFTEKMNLLGCETLVVIQILMWLTVDSYSISLIHWSAIQISVDSDV